MIWFTASPIDGSSDIQAGKVVLMQVDWQNSLVSLSNSMGSFVLVIYNYKSDNVINHILILTIAIAMHSLLTISV